MNNTVQAPVTAFPRPSMAIIFEQLRPLVEAAKAAKAS